MLPVSRFSIIDSTALASRTILSGLDETTVNPVA